MAKLFGWLPRSRWKRWLIVFAIGGFLLFLFLVSLGITAFLLWHIPAVQGWVMVQFLKHEMHQPKDLPSDPSLTREEAKLLVTNATALHLPGELFCTSNVWDVHLKFTSNQWAALGPNAVPPVLGFIRSDGSVVLRNPKASRNGLAGVFGIDFPWAEADLDFGDARFTTVAARFKGNGTFVDSQRSYKRPFKIELDKHMKSQELAGRTTLNFHNLAADASCLSDAMAYEFFRDAGVPASRTAFARLRLSIDGRFNDKLLGLYVLVENPDAQWAREHFGIDGVALFKPVTYELFNDLGESWEAYEPIYDPKTKLKPKQRRRLIALARLVTHASDAQFAEKIGDFIDLDEFARFLAGQVLLSNYDGFLSNGQNFLLYLEPRTDRFGFIPWDLDHSWGEFPFTGTREQREQASIWHPWIGENHFLERMLSTQLVREGYRRELESLRARLFLPERLSTRLNELAYIVRPFVVEESASRLARFERAVADPRQEVGTGSKPPKQNSRIFSAKRFFIARAKSVTEQLEGRTEGVVITRQPPR